MILKAKGDYGILTESVIKEYGISPVDGKENKKVWPKYELDNFCIVKGEEYNASKAHPLFEGGNKVSGDKKVRNDDKRPSDKGGGASGNL